MSNFFKNIFQANKNDPKEQVNKVPPATGNNMQSMYEFESEKSSSNIEKQKTGLGASQNKVSDAETINKAQQKQSIFSKMKVKGKEEKKQQYEPPIPQALVTIVNEPEKNQLEEIQKKTNYTSPINSNSSVLDKKISTSEKKQFGQTIVTQVPTEVKQQTLQQLPTISTNLNMQPQGITVSENLSNKQSSEESNHNNTNNMKLANNSQEIVSKSVVVAKQQKTSNSSNGQKTSSKEPPVENILSKKKSTPVNIVQQKTISSSKELPIRQETPKVQPKLPRKDEVKEIQNDILESKKALIQHLTKQKLIKNQIMNQQMALINQKERQEQYIRNQKEVLERQQYEQADILENRIAESNILIKQSQDNLENLQKQFQTCEQMIIKFYKAQNVERKNYITRLKRIRAQSKEVLTNLQKTENEKIEIQKVKIERERKKLNLLENEIKFNEEKFLQFENQYNEDLNNQTKLLKEQKDELEDKKRTIIFEIQEIQKKLKQKKEELVEVENSLINAENSIGVIKKGFEKEYKKIETRKEKIEQMKVERDEQERRLVELETLTNNQIKHLNINLQNMAQNIMYINEQSEEFQEQQRNFQQKIKLREERFSEFLISTRKMKEYENIHKKKRQEVKELEFNKAGNLLELTGYENKKKALKEKIPILEAEKIGLVGCKNFRGAQAKSNEIKQANEKLKEISAMIENCYIKDKSYEEEIANKQMNSEEKEEEERLIRNLAESQYNYELIKLSDLEHQRKSILRCKSGKQDDVLKFVENEMQQIREDIQNLEKEYGLKRVKVQLQEKEIEEEDAKRKQRQELLLLRQQQERTYDLTTVKDNNIDIENQEYPSGEIKNIQNDYYAQEIEHHQQQYEEQQPQIQQYAEFTTNQQDDTSDNQYVPLSL